MQAADPRAVSAARYWASRPGNWMVSAIFDRDDAQQEAALALLVDPDAQPRALYRRVLDAARRAAPGYRQRKMPQTVPLDDGLHVSTDCTAERATLLHQRVALLERLPPLQRAIVEHWLDGDDDKQAGAAHGMTGPGWRWHRKRLFDQLQRRGL